MNLVSRVKGILLNPRQEWVEIDKEPVNIAALLTGYVLPLAAIGPVATAIGWSVFGGMFGMGVGNAVTLAITMFILSIISVFVLGWVINALAPTFGATQNMHQALKVAVYCSTAAWVAGIFNIIPALALIAAIGGLYSLYLLYLGLPILMKSGADKAMTYTIVVILVTIVLYIIAGYLARGIAF